MTNYSEKNATGLLSGATDAENDTITIRRINGVVINSWPHTVTLPTGSAQISQTGTVSYNDGNNTSGHPVQGSTLNNGTFTFNLWDGVDESPIYTANLVLSGTTNSGPTGDTPVNSVTSISDNGVTWNFSQAVDAGQFWNGEWFIVVPSGSIGITSIAPASSGNENGAMKNFGISTQSAQASILGFSASTGSYIQYQSSANDDPGNTGSNLSVTAGDAVIKAISGGGSISRYRILTVLDSVPPVDSFRPAPHGAGGRTVQFSRADIDWSQLQSLTPPSGMLSPTEYRNNFNIDEVAVTWLPASHLTREYSPTGGQHAYGSSMGAQISQALLSLHGNYSQSVKEPLVADIVQKGLDLLGTVEQICTPAYDREYLINTFGFASSTPGRGFFGAGGNHAWADQSAFAAATLINNAGLSSLVGSSAPGGADTWNATSSYFQVSAGDVGRTLRQNGSAGGYSRVWTFEDGHVGMPHWGISHAFGPGYSFWGSDNDTANPHGSYLDINTQSFFGSTLFLMLCGRGDVVIDHDPLFDMTDRLARHMIPIDYFYGTDGTPNPLNTANSVTTAEIAAYANWRNSSARPVWTGQPEVIVPPTVAGGGSTLTVNRPATTDNGSSITRWDIRFRTTTTTSHSSPGHVFSESEDAANAGGWTYRNDISWNGSNQYSVTGVASGLYRVQVRAHNGVGAGPWSTNNSTATSDTTVRAVTTV